MEKTHDLVLNMVGNPTFTLGNLKTVGLTADNTALESEDKYLNSEKIQNMSMFKDDTGNFSKNKFHEFYKNAQATYNIMSSDAYSTDLTKQSRKYHRDNIFAPVDQRKKGPEIDWVTRQNPFRSSESIIRLGKTEESPYTWDELAQREKVLANPKEATRADGTIDESKAIWQDSPNDSWFNNFWETRVAAQWDSDGEHIDPTTGEKVKHSKGDLKLNSNGNFYYENLEGRDVYGRRVLNKMNTLTTDGSEWNKYDFFDSDGKDKSVGGTILKNTALVGSMFIPYVGPAVTLLSLATQTAGLMGTFGKMLANFSNDNLGTNISTSGLSEMEGFAKSVNRQGAVSEYAQNHMWSAENLIGMVGDVMAQFKEQRFLFEKAPLIFKNKYGIVNNKNYQSKLSDLENKLAKLDQTKMENLISKNKDYFELQRAAKELSYTRQARAVSDLDSYIKGYNKIGEILSKTYMTGITVADTYGEAKLQNASDNEAMWLTLGYAAGEAAILNTGIGEWLFPELRYQKLHQKAIAEALVSAKQETKKLNEHLISSSLKKGEKEAKKDYVKRLFNIGKQTAEDLYTGYKSTGDKTVKAALANALGEGTEEVSEEFLADFSKACFNMVGWLRGDDTRLEAFDNGNWQDLLSRYSMNFLGGFIGGGAAGFSLDNMRNMKKLDNMEFDSAIQELIYMVRNNETKDFLKTLDGMTLGDKRLSATKFTREGDNYIWEQGTEEDNQDIAAKNAIRAQVQLFEDILSSEGIKMSDDSMLSGQTDLLPEIKFALLKNSATAGRYLQEFNSLSAKLVQANASLLAAKGKLTETGEGESGGNAQVDIEENQKQQLQQQITQIEQQLQTATDEEQTALRDSLRQLRAQLGNQQNGGSEIQNIERELKELRKQKEALLTGKRAPEFLQDALYEMTDAINNDFIKPSFIRYAEFKTKKKFSEIPENLLGKLQSEWDSWSEMDRAEQVHISAEIFRNVLANAMPTLTQTSAQYEELLKSTDVANVQSILENWLNLYQDISRVKNTDLWLKRVNDSMSSLYAGMGLAFSDEDFADRYRQLNQNEVDITNTFNDEQAQLKEQIKAINLDETLSVDEKNARIEAINDQIQSLKENHASEKEGLNKQFREMMTEQMVQSAEDLINPYIKQGFANSEVKEAISQVIDTTIRTLKENAQPKRQRKSELMGRHISDEEQTELDTLVEYLNQNIEQVKKLSQLKKDLNELSVSPVEQILNQFTVSVGSDVKITKLLEDVNEILNGTQGDASQFSLTKDVMDQLTEALQVIDLLGSVIEASKVDEGNINHIYGYTKVLNDINHKVGTQGWVDLAELKSTTADVIKQDLAIIRNKLNFFRNLYAINSGQKLSEQRRVSLNKDYLFYNRLSSFVAAFPNDDDDWKGIEDLKATLNSLTNLKENAPKRNINLNAEDSAKIDEEVIKMEDAIYDFFQKNAESVKDPNKIAKLLKGNINLYEVPTDILTSQLEAIDDNSFVWWMVTRGAVKSTDFHKEYAAIIDGSIAPIPTQEIATYENYASIVNKDFFKNFYNGFREAIKQDWESKDKDGRLAIIRSQNDKLGENKKWSYDSAADDEFKDYPFVNLIIPKYSSIVFTEGIPGAGKSTGVYKSTIKMIQNNQSLRDAGILDNVAFIYAAGDSSKEEDRRAAIKNAERSIASLGLDPEKTKAYSLEDMMSSILVGGEATRQRTRCTQNEDGSWNVPDSRYTLNSDKEIRSTSEIINTDNPYTLIIIDEISNVGMFDLDDLNTYAEKYGITILGAGDCDQSGIYGDYTFKNPGTPFSPTSDGAYTQLPLNLYNINFIRTPKLGVSMRTANSQKTKNLGPAQYWVNNDCDLNLHYYEDDSGIYGDKVYNCESTSDVIEDIINDVDRMIATLEEGEKIGYVFDPENKSELYEKLTEDYADYIELLPGTTSQGKEAQYYIIEKDNSEGNFKNDLYTAITRSSQGSLIITNDPSINPIEDSETHSEKLEETAISTFANNRKQTLEAITVDGSPVQYVKPVTSRTSTTTPEPVEAPEATPETVETVTPVAETTVEETAADSIDVTSEPEESAPVASSTETTTETPEEEVESEEAFEERINNLMDTNGQVTLSNPDEQNRLETIHPEYQVTNNTDGSKTYKKPEPTEIESVVNSAGVEIHVGDYVTIPFTDPSIGRRFGHCVCLVDKINDDGTFVHKWIHSGGEGVFYIDGVIAAFDSFLDADNYAHSDEAKRYYQNEEPEIEDEVPEIDMDIAPTEEREVDIIEATSVLNPEPELIPEDVAGKLDIFLYSFNTFESGVMINNEGYPVQYGDDSNRHQHRLDSINGLMNLDKRLGNQVRKVEAYNAIISQIRTAIFHTEDKGELESKIDQILKDNFGITGISTTFGLVSHADQTQPDGFSTSSKGGFSRLQRHKDEDVQFVNSTGQRAAKTQRKTISIEIAYKGSDILELPLLTIANPITMINKGLIPKTVLETAGLSDITRSEDLDKIIESKDAIHTRFNGQYDSFVKLVEVYRNITSDSFRRIKDESWTPAKAFFNEGVTPIGDARGLDYLEYGFENKPNFIELSEFAKNPDLKISKLMYSKFGTIEDAFGNPITINGESELVRPGYPFVLVSSDKSLDNEKKLVNAFIEDLAAGNAPRVSLVYVLPPKIDMEKYVKNLALRYVGKGDLVEDVGNVATGFKILQILFKDQRFVDNAVVNQKQQKMQYISDILSELSQLDEFDLKEALMVPRKVLHDNGRTVSTYLILKNFLMELGYPDVKSALRNKKGEIGRANQENINLMTSILSENNVDGVFFRSAKQVNGQSWGPFNELAQNEDWTVTDPMGNRHSYQIHGNIVTDIFSGDITPLLDDFLSNNGKSDTLDYVNGYAVKGNPNPGKSKLKSLLNTVKSKTGLEIDPASLGEDEISEIASQINANTPYVAFNINGKLKIFSSIGNNKSILLEPNSFIELSSLELDLNGNASFIIKDDSGEHQANYYSADDTIEVFYPEETRQSTSVFDEITYKAAQDKIKENGKKFIGFLGKVMNASNSVEFTEALQNMKGAMALKERMFKEIFADDPLMLQHVLDTLKSQEQETQCGMRSIKLNLI